MTAEYEYRISRGSRHILGLIFCILLIFIIAGGLIIVYMPLYGALFVGIFMLITIIVLLVIMPVNVCFSDRIKIKYLFGREKELKYSDIEFYETNKTAQLLSRIKPLMLNLKLKNERKIIFFFNEKDYQHIDSILINHRVKNRDFSFLQPDSSEVGQEFNFDTFCRNMVNEGIFQITFSNRKNYIQFKMNGSKYPPPVYLIGWLGLFDYRCEVEGYVNIEKVGSLNNIEYEIWPSKDYRHNEWLIFILGGIGLISIFIIFSVITNWKATYFFLTLVGVGLIYGFYLVFLIWWGRELGVDRQNKTLYFLLMKYGRKINLIIPRMEKNGFLFE